MYNILCNGRKIYQGLSAEEVTEILDDFAHQYYDSTDGDINPNQFEIEVDTNGNDEAG